MTQESQRVVTANIHSDALSSKTTTPCQTTAMSWRYSARLGASERQTYKIRTTRRCCETTTYVQRLLMSCPVRRLFVSYVSKKSHRRDNSTSGLLSVTTRRLSKSRRASFPPARRGSPARSFPAQTGAVRAAH